MSFKIAVFSPLLLLLLVGCGKESRSGGHPLPSSPLVSTAEPGKTGGTFVLAAPGHPKTFNPVLALDPASDSIVRLLFSSLLRFDQTTQEPGPGIAESWSVGSDQKTWTFKLRKNVRWSNGQPLTADDVAFTWNEIMYNPQFNKSTLGVFQIGGTNFAVTNLDELTLQVVTPQVYAPFLEFFGSVAILPKHALSYAVKQQRFLSSYSISTPPGSVIGSGPFRLKEVRPGKFIRLERNPEFWMVDKMGTRLPYLEEVKIVVTENPASVAQEFLDSKSDAYETIRSHEYPSFKEKAKGGAFRLVELGIGPERDFLWFNQNTGTHPNGVAIVNPAKLKWFRDARFRQAVSCAIDRERIVREVYGGRAQPAYSFISSENPKWNNPKVPRYSFDLSRATRLLAEMGMKDRTGSGILQDESGVALEIAFISNQGNPTRENASKFIIENLRQIGIKLNYSSVPFEILRTKVDRTFDYECALMGLGGGGVDPTTQINVLRSSEELHQWFPLQNSPSTDWEARIDKLMDGQMTTLDFSERKKAFDEVQEILARELPMIYILSPTHFAGIRGNIGNVRGSALSPYHLTWNLEELYFKGK